MIKHLKIMTPVVPPIAAESESPHAISTTIAALVILYSEPFLVIVIGCFGKIINFLDNTE